MAEILFSEVTNATTSTDGTGYFDTIMRTVLLHVKEEWDSGRIKGTDYANVYLGVMQSAMQQAVQFALQKSTSESQASKLEYEIANTLPAQKALIERQTKGFDDDAKQKLLKQTLDSWSVAYSVAQDANSIPDAIKVNIVDSIAKNAMDSLSIVKTTNPLGEA